jgi:hypothetical protein
MGISSTTLPIIHPGVEIPRALNVTNDGSVTHTYTSAYFVNSSVFTPGITGHPTNTEIRNHLVGLSAAVQGSIKNRVIYFNGTTTLTTDYTYAWYFTGDSKLYLLDKPEPRKYLPVSVFSNALTSANNGDIVGSMALSFTTFGNTHQIYEFIQCCDVGVGTVLITIKDRANNVIGSTTLNAASGTASTSLFYSINSANHQFLKFEATTITGNVNNLAMTIEMVKI